MSIPNYRIISFDQSNMTAVIQFEGTEQLNYDLPFVDGLLPTGDTWNFWVASQYQIMTNSRWNEFSTVTNASVIEAMVNPEVWPYTPRT